MSRRSAIEANPPVGGGRFPSEGCRLQCTFDYGLSFLGGFLMAMTVRDVIRLIEADGWELVATRGSHRQYKHPSKPGRVTIAGHPKDDLATVSGARTATFM